MPTQNMQIDNTGKIQSYLLGDHYQAEEKKVDN